MTTRIKTAIAVGALLATGLALFGVSRIARDNHKRIPEAATPSSPPDPNRPPAPNDPTPLPQLTDYGDRGDPAQVAAVRLAVADLIQRANLALAMPASPAERAAEIKDGTKQARRAAELRSVFASSVAGDTIRTMEGALRRVQDDPDYTGYSDYRLTIDKWFGIIVDGDRAFAGFSGYEAYFKPTQGAWSDEGPSPWYVWLEREQEAWKLVTFRATSAR